jgi:xanthine dehydrogenase large subunit
MSDLCHESARAHVTGGALYTDDLWPRLPGALHAWPVCAPHAHARVLSLGITAALAEPGVATVLTAADVPGAGDSGANRRDEPIFPTEVMHHMQAVAWVLGESLDAAQRGAALVAVEYEPLPAILSIEEAIEQESFHFGPARMLHGDASRLEESHLVVEGELSIGGQEHFYLETHAAIAWLDESGGVSLQCSTQHPSEAQEIVARVLGIARNRVTVDCLRMGGAFGGKEVQSNPWAAIAALGAWKTRRPVRVRLTRKLDMALSGKRHPYLVRYAAGFDAGGCLEALRAELYSDGGWSLDLSVPVLWRSLFHCDNAYRLANAELTGYVCRSHKTSQTAFRGFGGPQGMLVIEEILDHAARRLGLRPEVIRERNFYREGDITHYGQQVKDADRISRIWSELKASSEFEQRRASIERFNQSSPYTKRGLAITPVKFGISFTATFFNQAGAFVLIYRDGSVQVNHGGTEMGQGLNTKILRIAARTLGVRDDAIRLMPASTGKVPNTSPTAASAGTDLNGAAVADACAQLRQRLTPVAARLLGCGNGNVEFSNGMVSAAEGTGTPRTFTEVCEAAYRERVGLSAEGYYRTPDIHYNPDTGRGSPFYYYAYAAAVSEVEVDAFTGMFRLLRADLLEDVGDSIAPLIDLGQIEGGFIQGLGWLTIEELLWDGSGRLATSGASTYKLPSWSELPPEFHVRFLERAAEPGVILGSKAVGEPPLMLAISSREAIREAIAAFGPGGPVKLDSPATPERIFFAIRERHGARLRAESPLAEVVHP